MIEYKKFCKIIYYCTSHDTFINSKKFFKKLPSIMKGKKNLQLSLSLNF